MRGKLLLNPDDIQPSFPDWEVKGILNPAAVKKDGRVNLFARVAEAPINHKNQSMRFPVVASKDAYDVKYEKIGKMRILKKGKRIVYLKQGLFRLTTFSHFKKIKLSRDGESVEEIADFPSFFGVEGEGDYGVEDPRITKIGDKYYMTYVGVSLNEGVSTYLAESKDLKKWKRLGLIFREQNKDVVLFPNKIKGKYVALHRPEGNFVFSKPSIWVSYSKDLIYWGKERSIMQPREKSNWEYERIGGGTPPMKTKKGWLSFYHGVSKRKGKIKYSAGAVLMDLKNPEHILARSPLNEPFIKPDQKYEKEGFIGNVVFPSGAVIDKKDILLYSGGADDVVSVKRFSLNSVFRHLKV